MISDLRWKKHYSGGLGCGGGSWTDKRKAGGSWLDMGFKNSDSGSGEITDNDNIWAQALTWVTKTEQRGGQEVGGTKRPWWWQLNLWALKCRKMMAELGLKRAISQKPVLFIGLLEEEGPNWMAWASNRRCPIIWKQQEGPSTPSLCFMRVASLLPMSQSWLRTREFRARGD